MIAYFAACGSSAVEGLCALCAVGLSAHGYVAADSGITPYLILLRVPASRSFKDSHYLLLMMEITSCFE